MNHVSVSPTDGNGPTQGQRKTLTRVGIVCLSLCGPISISRANAHMVHMGLKSSTSHYTLFSLFKYMIVHHGVKCKT